MNKLNDNPVVKHMRMLEKQSPNKNQRQSPDKSLESRFRLGNRSPSIIAATKPLIPDSQNSLLKSSPSRGYDRTREGGATKSNTHRHTSSNNVTKPTHKGYKAMDGKTYKSYLDYRKNSEKRLQEMSHLDDDNLQAIKQQISGRNNSRQPFLPDIGGRQNDI